MAVFTQKVEIILVVDRSGSLERYYEYLKRAISDMLNAIKNDPHLSGCDVYFTFITFASKMDDIKINAVPISNVNLDDLSFQCQGTTNPGPALKIAAETAISRYYQWKNSGEDAFHPLLVFFTDGYPYPEEKYMGDYDEAAAYIKNLVGIQKILAVCGGFGSTVVENLEKLTDPRLIVQINDGNVDKLSRFFMDLIPRTVTTHTQTKTDTLQQVADLFTFFNAS